MQQFPQQQERFFETSASNNHKLVRLNLDIGQCKRIYTLLEREYVKVEAGTLADKNNALLQLLDYFWQFIQPSDIERAANEAQFNAWLDSQDIDDVNALLQFTQAQGGLHAE